VCKARGKRIFVIPAVTNPYDIAIQGTMTAIARQYGVKYTNYPNQGQPTQWVAGMNEALSQKPDLIILNTALDPRKIEPQLRQAKTGGIPVMATHFFNDASLGTPCNAPMALCRAGLTSVVNAPFNLAAKTEADWIIADSRGNAHVMVLTSNDAAPSLGMVHAITREFQTRCGTCKFTVVNVPIPDWQTKIQGETQTALGRDSQLDYILPLYDSMSTFVVPGIRTAGRTGQVKIVSFNGTPFALKMLEKGNAIAMDVGEPLSWLGYAFMDQAFRILAGVKPVVSEHTPIRVFDSTNIKQTGTPPSSAKGYGNAYIRGYHELWHSK
jgi:ribose transport system substrate-binding protein